jgi:hypothetical protein
MRPVILLLVALLIFFVEIAQGDELPKRKPGLCELSWYSDEVTPTQSPIEPRIAKMCIDTKTDEKLAAAYDPCDPPVFLMFYARSSRRRWPAKPPLMPTSRWYRAPA